jgi:hypothetical protein
MLINKLVRQPSWCLSIYSYKIGFNSKHCSGPLKSDVPTVNLRRTIMGDEISYMLRLSVILFPVNNDLTVFQNFSRLQTWRP